VEIREEKRPLQRPIIKWVNKIKMDLAKTGWKDIDWTGLAQDMDKWTVIVNAVLNLQVP
jgi:hypothetical protein